MDQILLHLPILWVLCLLCCSEDNSGASVSCPENQKVFRNSCYEFVDLQLSFFSAQAWCEKSGGHLPFIPDAETQHFLQGNLDAEKDVWIGAAVSSPAEVLVPCLGSLSWLDGSYITYSYWAHRSPPGAACAHILKNSDYRWKPTDDCNSRLYFICQFESGRSIFCPDHSTALRCGSGEVIMIDGGFFGLQDIHYSHSTTLSPETPMMHQCSSMDPVNLCQGRQVCTVTGLQSRGEPCPWLGSCLSVDYRCKEGRSQSFPSNISSVSYTCGDFSDCSGSSCVNHTVDLQKDGFFFISLVWKKLTPHLLCLLSYDCYHLGFICDSWCCVFHKEEKYTWLIDPKMLKGNTGLHYLLVRPIVGPGIKFITANLSITSISTMCKFWNESLLEWSHNGCRVGIQTTPLTTQCLCNHLTFFGGSFFVTPNLVDPSRSAELFGTFAENPVVVCFVGALFVAYLLVVVWARRKDIQDTAKVKVTVLDDNDPLDEYRYLLSVSTGHRRGASTSSQVAIILLGSEGNSGVHHLTDPQRSVFERGAVDLFLLTTPFCLGDLQGIRLWHNNTGSHPAWFLSSVIVQDLQSEQKWHFICNSWLSIDMDDCSLDKMFPVSSEMEMKRFSNLFFMKTAKDFSDGHLWYSVISRPPRSSFTCVQRVSCCFSLLLCTMLTSIMFYGIPTDPSEQTMDLGHFEFTWQQFMIGVQSSLIMFPVNILMVSIFRQTRPRETPCCKHSVRKAETERSFQPATTNMNTTVTLDTVIKVRQLRIYPVCLRCLNPYIDFVLDTSTSEHPGTMVEGIQKKSNKTQYLYQQLCRIETELGLLRPTGFPNPHSYSQALQQVQGMKAVLEDQLSSPSDTTGSVDGQRKRGCFQGGLPWWFVFFGWLLVAGTSVVAGYFTMLYGLKFGKERSVSWLVSMIVSFFQSMFIIQPLKVIFFALVIKKVDDENFENIQLSGKNQPAQHDGVQKDSSLYEPPPPADVEKMKMIKMKEQKAFNLLTEILMYMGFMWMLLLVAYGQRDPNAFYLNRHIRNSFSSDTSDSMSLSDVFTWANTSLLHNLFGVYPGFITDGNSRLVGSARLRQLRVQVNSCQVPDLMLSSVPGCYGPYSWDLEDSGSYDPGWNRSVNRNASTGHVSPWTYQTQAQLRAQPVWGNLELYRGGGFVAELGPTSQNASSVLEDLFRNKWLDMHTRAVFAEFTVYNANVNLFCIVTLLFENTATGAFQFESFLQSIRLYQSTGGLHIFVMAAEIIYLLFILYYMFIQGKLMKVQRWSYFKSKWNLVELTIILLSWAAVAVFIKRTLIGNRDTTYYQKHRDQFASFYETASADSVLQYLISFLVLLSTIKLWHLLRLNPKMNMITATLQRAWTDISGFLVVIVIMLLAYSIGFNVIYGWKLSSYKTFLDALMTIISLQIGIFNYSEVLDQNPVLGAFFIGSCIVFMTFVVLNLFVSVILRETYQWPKYNTSYLKKSLFFRKQKKKKNVDPRGFCWVSANWLRVWF
uniref:Polycystic kidney disease 1 like 2a n=1 Tax=Sphaeramia orbicularis TaxID=375764 RepID=A0A673B6F1_9TELE